MNIRFIFFGVILLTFVSCYSSKVTQTTVLQQTKDCHFDSNQGECLIKSVKDDHLETFARFYYDQKNNLISFSDSQFDTAMIMYNPQKCLTEKIRFYTYDRSGTYAKFFYTNDELLKSVQVYDQSNNRKLSRRDFFYHPTGELSYDLQVDLLYPDTIKNEYRYANSNIVEIQNFSLLRGVKTLEATYVYLYDNKNNPYFHKRMPRRGRGFTEEAAYTLSKNNIIKRVKKSVTGKENIIEKEFVYNTKGYPIIEKIGSTTLSYEYYCLK